LNDQRWIKPAVVGVLWAVTFICILLASKVTHRYEDGLMNLLYLGIAFVIVISLVYFLSMKILGYPINLPRIQAMHALAYLFAGILIILVFNGMAALETQMQMAGDIADMEKLLAYNIWYTVLAVVAGMLMNIKGILSMAKGNIRLNVYMVPAFILIYLGTVYLLLEWYSMLEFGFGPDGIIGLMVGVFKITELQLVFLLLSGYLLVRGLERREMFG
jgi:hypothetical protein